MKTHCQICGREIKAKSGMIAHHGYRRPHQSGYQTSSCYGARHLPYEVSRDAIGSYMLLIRSWIEINNSRIEKLQSSPPEKLSTPSRRIWDKPVEFSRPEGFTPPEYRGSYNPSTYEGQWIRLWNELQREDRDLRRDLQSSRERYDQWVAPVDVSAESV